MNSILRRKVLYIFMIVLYNFLNDHGESVREIYDLTETIKGLGNLEILPNQENSSSVPDIAGIP